MDGNRKNLIFSIFTPLEDDACEKFLEYYDVLVENKKEYANKIGVDFKMITPNVHSYLEANHIKWLLMEEFAEEYDKVMYVDLDVVFNTDENIFDHHDGFCLHAKDYSHVFQDIPDNMNVRSWYYKACLAGLMAMYTLDDYDGWVPNTGLMITDRSLGFHEALPELKELVDQINEEGIGPFKGDYNNEGLFAYYSAREGIKWNLMDDDWNHIHRKGQPFQPNKKVYHMISKEFEWLFNNPQ